MVQFIYEQQPKPIFLALKPHYLAKIPEVAVATATPCPINHPALGVTAFRLLPPLPLRQMPVVTVGNVVRSTEPPRHQLPKPVTAVEVRHLPWHPQHPLLTEVRHRHLLRVTEEVKHQHPMERRPLQCPPPTEGVNCRPNRTARVAIANWLAVARNQVRMPISSSWSRKGERIIKSFFDFVYWKLKCFTSVFKTYCFYFRMFDTC